MSRQLCGWFLTTLVAVLSLSACVDEPVGPPMSSEAGAQRRLHTPSSLGHVAARIGERAFAAAAEEFPGSAGFYFDEAGGLIVRHVNPARGPAFAEWVLENVPIATRGRLGGSRPAPLALPADYDYLSLASWRESATYNILPRDGVHFVDFDEVKNRVVIGVRDETFFDATWKAVEAAGIPKAAVNVAVMPEALEGASLDDFQRPLSGGLLIQHKGSCTLGWTARQGDRRYAITASHCTNETFEPETSLFWQWDAWNDDNYIGPEAIDPDGSSCGFLGKNECRYSDAAAIRLNAETAVSFGYIARTTFKERLTGSTTIDAADSLLTITNAGGPPYTGQPSEKVGRTTG
jgi:hypothetical protein